MAAILIAVVACGEQRTSPAPTTQAQRIVSLAPNLTELVYTVGAGDRLVGVSAWSDFPPEVASVAVVGDAFTVDLEALQLLAPDLLLVWESGMPPHRVDELRTAGYNVVSIRTRGLDDIAKALEAIGALTGLDAEAASAASEYRQQLGRLREQFAGTDAIRVFYQVAARPLYTLNREHYVSELIELCGGRNVFAELDELAPTVDVEAVVNRDPEVMLASTDAGEAAFAVWQRWPAIAANRLRNHYRISADHVGRATTRVVVAGEAICAALQQARANRATAVMQ